ncbi:Phenylacetate-CoA oxygenase, PaaG subunit [Pseudomonas chlororaphis subsp. aurantiaca]|nr:Phenylacetate-CoA oxygenase, PaaG subunit [Pseudomonas chlororaphis subsp. aurantiaca]
MYAQLVETGVKSIKPRSEMSEQERAFQEKSIRKSRSKPRTGCRMPIGKP